MKTSLLLLAIVACACAVYALPEAEERHPEEQVPVDLDKLAAELSAAFADEAFLEQNFGHIADANVQFAGKFGWLKKLPWGQIIDAVIGGVKKVFEPSDKKDD